jgi:hypothetical protein
MGCSCFSAQNVKTEEICSESEAVSPMLNNLSNQRILFTVREENHETTESRSLSRVE